MEYINKMKEEMILGFYRQLRIAKKEGYKVSINYGMKQLTGKIVNVSKFAVMIDRGNGVISTIAMDKVKMITLYTGDDEDEGEQDNE